MGTTNRSVNKQEGKVPDAVLEKAKAEERKSNFFPICCINGFRYGISQSRERI